MIEDFKFYLRENEKSEATVEKYVRDVRGFLRELSGGVADKNTLISYKAELLQSYTVRSANSMLASLNAFFRFLGWEGLKIKSFKLQNEAYLSKEKELTKEEYTALVRAAEKRENKRLSLLVQTICATGIRVSELRHITAEAVKRGEAIVSCKGKTRKVFIVSSLQKKLFAYMKSEGIESGTIFVTKSGKPLDRSNIWRQMKALCITAGIAPAKVFPHNLRHLFARTFYGIERDIAKLADVLGHSNINTTRIYIATSGAEHQRRMENMHLIL